nr:potassium channel AKT1-like [Tanacetum cinerariifolium]
MWEAILGGHEPVVKILKDNGADLLSGDVGKFSCTAAEENKLDLLKQIVKYGGDVTLPKSNGSTALHVAVCEGNIEIVKYLLKKGADIDKPDDHGWTPRDLAEQQGHHDIRDLFLSVKETDDYSQLTKTSSLMPFQRAESRHVQFLGRFKSDPILIRPVTQDENEGSSQPRQRRRANNFHNSLFGIMSNNRDGENNIDLVSPKTPMWKESPRRVIVSCPKKGDVQGKLVLLPQTFEDLLQVGVKKFGFLPSRVLNEEGAEIDEIELIRDGDHLVFDTEDGENLR